MSEKLLQIWQTTNPCGWSLVFARMATVWNRTYSQGTLFCKSYLICAPFLELCSNFAWMFYHAHLCIFVHETRTTQLILTPLCLHLSLLLDPIAAHTTFANHIYHHTDVLVYAYIHASEDVEMRRVRYAHFKKRRIPPTWASSRSSHAISKRIAAS